MSTFMLPNWSPGVAVTLPSNITRDQLLKHGPFEEWLQTLKKSLDGQTAKDHIFYKKSERYTLRSIKVHQVDWFGPNKIGFLKMEAVVKNDADKDALPGIIFLRGGSVAILIIVREEGDPEEKRWVVMTKQPRIPAGSLTFYEIPAGMLDGDNNFAGKAATELEEETELHFPAYALTDMTANALADAEGTEPHLQKAMYPSPGGCDEYIKLFVWEGTKPATWFNTHFDQNRDKIRGTDREKIQVKLVEYEELFKEGARDAKTLAAWALYEGLTRANKLYRTHSNSS